MGGSWSCWLRDEMLTYQELRSRIPVAASLNAKNQDATDLSGQAMRGARDADNCFRIVELGIPAGSDVVIVARPIFQGGPRPIHLSPPRSPGNVFDARSQFRILQGHTIKNLIQHRNASMRIYFGFCLIGVLTAYYGQSLISDSLHVSYEKP